MRLPDYHISSNVVHVLKTHFSFVHAARPGSAARRGTERFGRVAAASGATPAQVALAWLLRRSPVMLPIPCASSVAHLEENLVVASLELDEAQLSEVGA